MVTSSQVRLNKGVVLKPWDCADKENFLKGHPKHLIKKKAVHDDLLFAIHEAEDYLSTSEEIRLPPHMAPSDLDPTIEPPPPIEREELVEDDEEDDDVVASDHEGDEKDEQEDEDVSGGGSDNEAKKGKNKKKSSAKEKKSSSSSKEKKPVKEKKPAKEKKASKPKKEKASSSSKDKEPKEKKKSAKKDKEPTSQEDKKRKKPATTDESSVSVAAASASEPVAHAAAKASPGKASPSKVARKEKAADVKSGDAKPSSSSGKSGKSKNSGSELTGEALSAVLETEIKWILANCQFDEMTTKTVRKLLEKRLNMDLRHHKASIKDGVARVIASMEDGTDAPAEEVIPVKTETAPPAPPSDPVPADAEDVAAASPAVTTEDVEMEKPEEPEAAVKSDELEAKKDDDEARVTQHLVDVERELGLALNEEPKLVTALTALQQQLPNVDKELFAKSPLVAKLVELRAHEETSVVAKLVAAIAQQWDVEELVPAPKPIHEEDILEMKEKLESAETSHDDMLACLDQLAKVRIVVMALIFAPE